MPIAYARRLTGHERTLQANAQLGCFLAFIAGAINAGGFLVVHQYTSHLTGIASSMADSLALARWGLALDGLGAIVAFLLGAATSSVLVNVARARSLASVYAIPLLLEAVLLLGFGVAGARDGAAGLPPGSGAPAVMLLCFIMGLQNALISKVSRSEIRTTHITGTITDIGIELGRLAYAPAHADRRRLRLLSALATCFVAGGVAGALGFLRAGTLCTVPIAAALIVVGCVPAIDDLRKRRPEGPG